MRDFIKINLILIALPFFALAQKELIISKWQKEGVQIFKSKFKQTSYFEGFEISMINLWRGDVHIKLKHPPFAPRSWTVNRFTGQIIPWASENDPILQTLSTNKKGR